MKRIYISIFILLSVFILNETSMAQDCSGVTVDAFPRNPQSGLYNYFGVRVTLSAPFNQDVTVTGYIHAGSDEANNTDHPFTLTVPAGSLSAETQDDYYQTGPTGDAGITVASINPCPVSEITATYAGVTITYEVSNNLLRFNSVADLNTVLDQLDADYDSWNDAYDNNYDPNLTSDQMDDIDDQTGFDEFHSFRVFEGLFSGFSSKRMDIENTETAWLNSDFATTDPATVDLTFDDAANAIFNNNNSFKVGNDVYQLSVDGMYINGVLQASVNDINGETDALARADIGTGYGLYANRIFRNDYASMKGPSVAMDNYYWMNDVLAVPCKSNKKKHGEIDNGSEKFKLKVAINSWYVRSGVKGKVVHYKRKNNRWKRSRSKMAALCAGTVYDNQCNTSFNFSDRKPAPNGWKNRRQLKVARHQPGTIWRTHSGEVSSGFDTQGGTSGTIVLTF